jgi:HlyD family secretion protein
MTNESLVNRMAPMTEQAITVRPAPNLPLLDNGKGLPAPPGLLSRVARLRLWRIPLVMAFLFTGAVVGLYFQPPLLKIFFGATGLEPGGGTASPIAVPAPPPEPPAPAVSTREVVALGRLLPEGDVVTLALPSGAGDARIAQLLVTEGEEVEAGAVVAELDNLPQLAAQVTSAEAQLAAREAALARTKATISASLREAQASRDRAAATGALAAGELARVEDLAQRGVVPQAELDTARARAEQAARELDTAVATLSRYEVGEDGVQPDILLAEREVDTARAELEAARHDLAKGNVVAPQAGTLLRLHVRPGEKPGPEGVAELGAIDRMQAELEVYQTDVRQVDLGQPVTLTAEALDNPLSGRVDRIGLEVERQAVLADDPAASADARVVRVIVALDEESSQRARRFTGLEVVGRIAAGEP